MNNNANTDVMQDIRQEYSGVWERLFPKGKPATPETMTLRTYRSALGTKIKTIDILKECQSGSSSELALVAHVLNICGYRTIAEKVQKDAYWSLTYFDSHQTRIMCKLICYWDHLDPFSEKKELNDSDLDKYKVCR